MITVISDDPQIYDMEFVYEHIFTGETPEMVYALKQINETQSYSYKNSVVSMDADFNHVRACVLFDDEKLYFEFDRQLFIEVLSAYVVKCYQHKDILYPFIYPDIRSLDEVLHLLK